MAVYYGVIKNNRVVLDTDVQLAEGMPVEIRPRLSASNPEDAFKKLLLAEGLMTELPSSEPMSPCGCDGLSLSKASPCLRRLSPRGVRWRSTTSIRGPFNSASHSVREKRQLEEAQHQLNFG